MEKLTGNADASQSGSMVMAHQKMGTEQGFSHVNADWLSKTLSYEQGLDLLEKDRAKTHDILASLSQVKLGVNSKDRFVLNIQGNEYQPTLHAIGQMANWGDTGRWLPQYLSEHVVNEDEETVLLRDKMDAETIVQIFKNGFRRLDQDKKFLWRLREDGTMRAMLSEIYARIDNRWFIELMKSLLPNGRLSHWESNADTIWGNVLIPDSLRKEEDSDYAAMLSLGNSEIGERRISSTPSIFRAICMNGCIHQQIKGIAIRQVHRGKIDLIELAEEIAESIHKQLDVMTPAIETLLKTKAITWKGVSVKPVIAAVANKVKLTKRQATQVLKSYNEELSVTPALANSLFSLVNGVTRAAQKFDPAVWVHLDTIGGDMSNWDRNVFGNVVAIAKDMKEKDVEAMFLLNI